MCVCLFVCVVPEQRFGLGRRRLTLLPIFQTDKSGCASQSVNVSEFAPNKRMYEDLFKVTAELEEFGTGGYRRAGVRRASCWS